MQFPYFSLPCNPELTPPDSVSRVSRVLFAPTRGAALLLSSAVAVCEGCVFEILPMLCILIGVSGSRVSLFLGQYCFSLSAFVSIHSLCFLVVLFGLIWILSS